MGCSALEIFSSDVGVFFCLFSARARLSSRQSEHYTRELCHNI